MDEMQRSMIKEQARQLYCSVLWDWEYPNIAKIMDARLQCQNLLALLQNAESEMVNKNDLAYQTKP